MDNLWSCLDNHGQIMAHINGQMTYIHVCVYVWNCVNLHRPCVCVHVHARACVCACVLLCSPRHEAGKQWQSRSKFWYPDWTKIRVPKSCVVLTKFNKGRTMSRPRIMAWRSLRIWVSTRYVVVNLAEHHIRGSGSFRWKTSNTLPADQIAMKERYRSQKS